MPEAQTYHPTAHSRFGILSEMCKFSPETRAALSHVKDESGLQALVKSGAISALQRDLIMLSCPKRECNGQKQAASAPAP